MAEAYGWCLQRDKLYFIAHPKTELYHWTKVNRPNQGVGGPTEMEEPTLNVDISGVCDEITNVTPL